MHTPELLHEGLTRSIIGAFYEVYNQLGYGFLEQVYARARAEAGRTKPPGPARVPAPCLVQGDRVGTCRADMVVDEMILVETKSTFTLHDSSQRQLLNYLTAAGLDIGFIMHFGPQPRFRRLIRSDLIPGARRRDAGS